MTRRTRAVMVFWHRCVLVQRGEPQYVRHARRDFHRITRETAEQIEALESRRQ